MKYDPNEMMAALSTEDCIDITWSVLEGGDPLGFACDILDVKLLHLTDNRALNLIHEILDGVEWDAGTIELVAEVVENSGRKIREPFWEEDE